MRLARFAWRLSCRSRIARDGGFVGRWAATPRSAPSHGGDTAANSALVATDTSLWWFDGYCRIGKMYKAKAVYVQAHCGEQVTSSVTLDATRQPHAGDLGQGQARGAAAVQLSAPGEPGTALSDAAAPTESVFRHRAFALYWFSRIASILSFHMLVVAVGWQLYELTGSAFDLGLLGLAQFGPMLVLTLFVGHVADRYDHRLILMLCQIIEAARAAILVYATATGSLGTPVIYVVIAVVGAARAFEIPTMAAIIPSLVPRAVCRAAMAWFASANQTGQIVGPALGGVLYLLGPTTVYGITIVLWGSAAFMLSLMRVERAPRSHRAVQPAFAARRISLRAARPHHPRHAVARHVRGVSRRRDRAVADLCPRHPADRAVGTGPSALGAGDRRADHVDHPGAPSADPAGRPRAVQRADDLRPRGTLLCLLDGAVALDGGAGRAWARPTWSAW